MSESKPGRLQVAIIVSVAVLVLVTFSNSLNGEFVYDDKRQILRNPLIQNSELYLKALTSDVWAFKGDGTMTASNYWRPTFTAYSILNYLFFGADPFGWHLLNVLLHALVSLLIFLFVRKLGSDTPTSFAIAAVFAVHPVHTESVTWIAGSPDILFGFFLLLSLWFALRFAESGSASDFCASLAAFLPALGAKEVALTAIPVLFLIFWNPKAKKSIVMALRSTALFAAAGFIYFVLRWIVLGRLHERAPDAAGAESVFFTAPSVFLFYLKQTVFPINLGPNYSIRAVEGFSVSFAVSAVLAAGFLYAMYLVARRSRFQMIGFALFLLPLLPAFSITTFTPEQIVHDRYLYLPLLGFLMLFVPEIVSMAQTVFKESWKPVVLVGAAVIAIVLGIRTYTYNIVWLSDLALWKHAVTVDSTSSFSYMQLGATLAEKGEIDASIEAYNRSMDLRPTPLAYLGRAHSFIAKKRFEEAISDLKTVAEMPGEKVSAYSLYQVYEALAVSYDGNGDIAEAASVLRAARKRLPIYRAALTEKLAVVLYKQNKKEEVLKELESVRQQALVEMLPESKKVFFRLGLIYSERGEKEKSVEALRQFLVLTSNSSDEEILQFRKLAADAIK